jgi:hypothetical protein
MEQVKLDTKESQEDKVLEFLSKFSPASAGVIETGTGIFKLNVYKIMKKLTESGKVLIDKEGKPPIYSLANKADETGKAGKKDATAKKEKTEKIDKKPVVKKATIFKDDEVALTKEGGRDVSKFIFNKVAYPKSRCVLEVIRQYAKDHPKITLQILQTVFKSNDLQKRYGTIVELYAAKKFETSSGRPRHFMKSTDIINVNGRKVVVSNQWDANNFEAFRKICTSLKYTIKKQQ